MNKILRVVALGLRSNSLKMCFYIVMMLFITAISISTSLTQKDIMNTLNRDIHQGKIEQRFILGCIIFVSLTFLMYATNFFHTFVHNLVKQSISQTLQKTLMYKSNQTAHDEFYKTEFQKKYSFICRNIDNMSQYIMNILNTIFRHGSTMITIFVVFMMYVPELILYMFIITAIYSITYIYTSKKKYDVSKNQINLQREDDYYSSVLMNKDYAKEIRLNHVQNYFLDIWSKIYEKLFRERYTLANRNNRLVMLSEYVSFLCQASVMFLLIYRCYTKMINLGEFVMLLDLVIKCKNSVNFIVDKLIAGTFVNVLYFNDYAEFVLPVTREEERKILICSIEDEELVFGTFEKMTVNNLSYEYPHGEKNAVNNVSFELKRGEVICILGYNGSGKSTLVKLLSGILTPKEGTITINGQDSMTYGREKLSQYFGIAFQEFPKYSISLRDNVGVGKIERIDDQEQLNVAYKATGLNQFISKYESGDNIILGKEYDDKGVDLSGGEWQKVILSQAYMGKPEIIIFDEPTASLDPMEEMKIINNLKEQLEGRTAILISHRIGFARMADRILMMRDGNLVEQGSHDELIDNSGYYTQLFRALQQLYR